MSQRSAAVWTELHAVPWAVSALLQMLPQGQCQSCGPKATGTVALPATSGLMSAGP